MILSIAMIVKDEEKYLEKTLSALKPLMNEIESELIIVDTGSTDKTVEIAKRYTDKVYFKEWTGDFAEMRNESFKYVTGEWILVLDADEELTEYTRFVEFLKSEDSKKYNTLSISLKNFCNETCTQYTRAPLLRVFRNDGNFKYIGIIHEQPVFKTPVYTCENGVMEFNHYGYIYEDESIRQKKMKRNEDNILKELEKNPNDAYMNYQMGQHLICLNKLKDAVFYLEKSNKEYDKSNITYIPVIIRLLNCYNLLRKYPEIENLCLKYLKKDKKNIDIYYYLALSCLNMYKYDRSFYYYQKYFYYIENYNLTTQSRDYTCPFDSEKYYLKAVSDFSNVSIKLKKYKEALELIEKISQDYADVPDSMNSISMATIELLLETKNLEKINEYYKKSLKFSVTKKTFVNHLENYIFLLSDNEKQNLYKGLSLLDDEYGILNKCRLGDVVEVDEILNILKAEKEYYYGDMLPHILKSFDDLQKLKNINNINLLKYFDHIFKSNGEFTLYMYNLIKENPIVLNEEELRICSIIELSLINSRKLSLSQRHFVFKRYQVDLYRNLKVIYKDDINDDLILINTKDISEDIVVRLKKSRNRLNENKTSSLQCIKDLMLEYPSYKDVLDLELNEEIKKIEDNIKEPEEKKKLRIEFKCIIEKAISENNLNLANTLLDEYTQINGLDDEILNMKAIVELSTGNIDKSLDLLKSSFEINPYNYNTIYNIAYVNKLLGNMKDTIDCYNCILRESNDLELVNQVKIEMM